MCVCVCVYILGTWTFDIKFGIKKNSTFKKIVKNLQINGLHVKNSSNNMVLAHASRILSEWRGLRQL